MPEAAGESKLLAALGNATRKLAPITEIAHLAHARDAWWGLT